MARSSDGALLAQFERFTRNRAMTIKIEQITPQPMRVSTSGTRHVYEFASTRPDSVIRVVLRYRPETLGWLPAVITSAQSQLRFRQLVYP